MKALHCLWIPKGYDGELFVWCEDPERFLQKGKHAGKDNTNPYALSGKELKALLKDVLGEGLAESENIRESEIELLLPARGKAPQISKRLAGFYEDLKTEKYEFSFWRVEGITVEKQALCEFLFSIPANEMPSGIILGDDVLFWIACLKFSFELAVRQRFLPGFYSAKNKYYALWKPSYDTPKDRERFLSLGRGMPAVCRSFSENASPSDIVDNFISTVIDSICRISLISEGHIERLDMEVPIERWMASLAGKPLIKKGAGIEELKAKWEKWIARNHIAESQFRMCFKLDLEENGKDEWLLRFFLQHADDPTILIPAGNIWKGKKGKINIGGKALSLPHEYLLASLGTAARFFPPLENSLEESAPELCRLGSEDVYSFLKESCAIMEEVGFGVLMPSWLKKGSQRLGIKLELKDGSTKVSGAGMMGLDTVLAFDWKLALGDQMLTKKELDELARLKVPFVKIRGKWVEFDREKLDKTISYLKSRDQLTLADALKIEAGIKTGLPVVGMEFNGAIKNIFESLKGNSKVKELAQPKNFNGQLRKYQMQGFAWLDFLSGYGFGACLADDMGLGKTIQMIALLLHKKESGNIGPALLICPTSVVGNWERELKRFSPSLRILVHHGERLKGRDFEKEAMKNDIVITTYSLSHRDEEINKISWDIIVLDEAQNIKNPYTKQAVSISSLKSKKRIVLTGTPVENRLSELWSIMNFLNPGFLGTWKEFKERFAIPIERYNDSKRLEALRKLIQPFLLRRVKTDSKIISDLPEKQENKVYCSLTKEQASLYKAVVDSSMEDIENSEGIQRKGIILAVLTKLKQICNHPANFSKDQKNLENRSGKLDRLKEMVEEVLEGSEKCLIFTQFREMGGLLKAYLQEQFNTEILFLHGGVNRKTRETYIKRFQEGEPKIFVLSLKAGGTGLNLTAANHVFHFDRWWNPAVENQATDRAFRIGQKKNVFVHKLVCEGTVEEKIDQMIEKKKGLAESVVGKGEGWITELSAKELRDLFSLRGKEFE